MFFMWDGMYVFFYWKIYIDRVHTEDFEFYVFVDPILLTPKYDDISSLLSAMHDINKFCSYLLVFFHLFMIYILYFRLYYLKFNQFDVFLGRLRILTFLPIWSTLCIRCKALTSCLWLPSKNNWIQNLKTMWGEVCWNLVLFNATNVFRLLYSVSCILILHLMIGYQSLHIGFSWQKKPIKELHSILSPPLHLPTDVPTLSEYIQT